MGVEKEEAGKPPERGEEQAAEHLFPPHAVGRQAALKLLVPSQLPPPTLSEGYHHFFSQKEKVEEGGAMRRRHLPKGRRH